MNSFVITILVWLIGVPVLCLIGIKVADIYWALKGLE